MQKSKYTSKTKLSSNSLINNKSKGNKQFKNKNRTISSDNRIKYRQKIKIEEEKSLKQSQENLKGYFKNVNNSKDIKKEKKMNNSINRLINTSMNLLKQQNDILLKADNLMQDIEMNNHEINKIIKKEEKYNFCKYVGEYNQNLENILYKLKQNTKDLEFSNKVKEENNNLKYRIQMLSIDKSDDFQNIETELNSLKKIYTNEMNSMLRYIYELGFDDKTLKKIKIEDLTTDIIVNFFNLIKNIIKQLKQNVEEKEAKFNLLKKIKNLDNNDMNENNVYKYQINSLNNNTNKDNNYNSNYSSIENYKNSINNERLKKIEDLCLKHTYDIDNIKENNNISKSYFDNFQRTKNIELNNNSEIQLEHNYTDSNFYQNIKDSSPNKNKFDEFNYNNNIEYISRINESQPMDKFI